MDEGQFKQLAVFVAVSQLSLVILEMSGRIILSEVGTAGDLTRGTWWVVFNLTCVVFTLATLLLRKFEWVAMLWAGTTMGVWAAVQFITRIKTDLPVAGPVFVGLTSLLAFWLTYHWTDKEFS